MVLIMVIQGLYNIIDKNMAQSFTQDDIMARFGITAKNADNLVNLTTGYTMTAYYTIFSFAMLFGVGCSIVFSMEYGKRNIAAMRKIMGNMIVLQIITSIFISTVVFFLMNNNFHALLVRVQMNSSLSSTIQEHYVTLDWEYSRIFIFCSPLLFLSFALPTFLRTEGKVFIVLLMQVLSIPVNVLFSFIFAKLCHLEMSGVMMGSMMAWTFNICFSTAIIIFSKNSYCKFGFKDMKLSFAVIKRAMPIGVGAFFMNFANAIQILISTILVVHLPGQDDVYFTLNGQRVQATSVGIYICQLVYTSISPFMVIFISAGIGLSQGATAICAYAYGAKKYQRIEKILFRVAFLELIWFFIVFIIILAFADQMMKLYEFPAELVGKYRWYAVLNFSTYLFAAATYTAMTLYSSIGRPVQTMISSMLRSLLVIVPLSLIGFGVSNATGNNIDYFVFTGLNDLICALILIPMLYTTWRKNKAKLIDYPDDFVQQAKDNAVENDEQNIIIHNDSK
ncbi:MATE family efflux transporter [Spiroplasma eriocheiris]|nr:MATE family efflux transporter [Spiroplasma eriocheiris]AHF57577.1 putative drug/sodium antiporter extrusion protein [Spiroplasma eriocheiris CCTCC M 207170]